MFEVERNFHSSLEMYTNIYDEIIFNRIKNQKYYQAWEYKWRFCFVWTIFYHTREKLSKKKCRSKQEYKVTLKFLKNLNSQIVYHLNSYNFII